MYPLEGNPRTCRSIMYYFGYPGTYPSMTQTTRLGTRVPQSIPEYEPDNEVWYPGTPEYIPL